MQLCNDKGSQEMAGFFIRLGKEGAYVTHLITAAHLFDRGPGKLIIKRLNKVVLELEGDFKHQASELVFLDDENSDAIMAITAPEFVVIRNSDVYFGNRLSFAEPSKSSTLGTLYKATELRAECSMISVQPQHIKHMCNTKVGDCGCPLIDHTTSRVIGVHVGGQPEVCNYALRLDHFLNETFPSFLPTTAASH